MDILKKKMETSIQFLLLQMVIKRYQQNLPNFWDTKGILETINGGRKCEYEKDFMKIRFNLYDNLPLNKIVKLHMLTVIVRSVFNEYGKVYPIFFR